MREIKFRAWDKKYSEMIFTGFHVLGEVTAFSQIEQYLFETKQVDNIPTIERWNDIELMQFTGLKDKNGKEIYEGDILKLQYPIRDVEGYDNNYILLNVIIEYHGGAFWFSGGGYTDCNWHFYNEPEREIIGNIYENPELL